MKGAKLVPAFFAVAVGLLILKSFFDHSLPGYTFPHWEHGASGYDVALKEAEAEGTAIIVYFHTSWCTWCKKLDNNYLATDKVEKFLKNIPKVEINPDKGEAEKNLMNRFGITGYPSFLVINPKLSSAPVMISPFMNTRELTVEEFMDKIKQEMVFAYEKRRKRT